MTTVSLDRRCFIAATSASAIAVALGGCAGQGGIGPDQKQMLVRLARHLYPHQGLAESEFQVSLAPLVAATKSDPQLAQLVRRGADALDEQANGDWLAADESSQIEAIASLEQGAFFAEVQGKVRGELYKRSAVWEIIGYEGPSLEYGGYLERGFDDIDWLPEA